MTTIPLDLRPEPDARRHLERWSALADPSLGLVTQLVSEDEGLADEPSWPLVRADLAPTAGIDRSGYRFGPACGGRTSESWETPWVSALFEGIERYCVSLPDRDRLQRVPYAGTSDYLDPASLLDVDADEATVATERQRERWWIPGRTLTGRTVQVPAQSVYVPFRDADWEEPLLRDSVSTGGAAGLRRDWAVVRGFLEAAERDAVMLLHFEVAGWETVEAERLGGQARRMIDELAALGMSTTVLRVHTGLPLAAVVVRVEDGRGVWPRAALGSCARLDLDAAVSGALLEAAVYKRNLRARPGYFADPVADRDEIQCLEDRASYWYGNDRLLDLDYFRDAHADGRWQPVEPASSAQELMDAVVEDLDPIVVDVTTPDVARLGAHVVKVVVPSLQPMYLSEARRTRTRRLGAVPLDERPPHPFL